MGQASSTALRRRNSRQELSRLETSRSTSPLPGSHPPATSPVGRSRSPLLHSEGRPPPPLHIPQPDSSISSPVPSPRSFLATQRNLEPTTVSGSASPRSVPTSAYNSWQGDPALRPQQQYEDRSPIPSPRLRSPGPSRNTSATVSPLHPRAGVRTSGGPDSPTTCWHEERSSQYPPQPLPLPPGSSMISNNPYTSPPITSAPSTPTLLSRHSSRVMEPQVTGTPTKWQKGKCLGSGTFGNVYVGFNK